MATGNATPPTAVEVIHGLTLTGELVAIRNITYGKNHATKAGQAVPGFREVVVNCVMSSGYQVEQRASFSDIERATGEPSSAAVTASRWDWSEGDLVCVRVAVTGMRNGYPQLNAVALYPLGDTAARSSDSAS